MHARRAGPTNACAPLSIVWLRHRRVGVCAARPRMASRLRSRCADRILGTSRPDGRRWQQSVVLAFDVDRRCQRYRTSIGGEFEFGDNFEHLLLSPD